MNQLAVSDDIKKLQKKIENLKKTACDSADKKWVTSLGKHLSAKIFDVKTDQLVHVIITGSAKYSEFYFGIIETTGHTKSQIKHMQIISNPGFWLPFSAQDLYYVEEDAENIEFKVNFRKVDLSGKVTVRGLNIVARCIA